MNPNEIAIIDLYQELKNKYSAYHSEMSHEEAGEFTQLLKDLKNRAADIGIDVTSTSNNLGAEDDTADVLEMVALSQTSNEIRKELSNSIRNANPQPTNRQVFDFIQLIDKFYFANVTSSKLDNIEDRLADDPSVEYFSDKQALLDAYQSSSQNAIIEIIRSIATQNWSSSIEALDVQFQAFFVKQKKLLKTSRSTVDLSPAQFSLNVPVWKVIDTKHISIAVSFGLEFSANQNDLIQWKENNPNDTFENFTVSLLKQGVSKDLTKGFQFPAKFSTTLLTVSNSTKLTLPFIENLEEIFQAQFAWNFKVGAISGEKPIIDKNNVAIPQIPIGITLFSIQAKLQADWTNFFKKYVFDENFPIKKIANLDLNLTLAVKYSGEMQAFAEKMVKPKPIKPNVDDLPDKDKKALKKMGQQSREIGKHVDDIVNNLKDKDQAITKNAKAIIDKKNAALSKEIADKAKVMKQAAKELSSEAGEKLGKEVVENTGFRIVKKLGSKMAGKVLLKFIPGINLISTIIDIIEIGTLLYNWFSTPKQIVVSEPQNPTMMPKDTSNDLIMDEKLREDHSDAHRFK